MGQTGKVTTIAIGSLLRGPDFQEALESKSAEWN